MYSSNFRSFRFEARVNPKIIKETNRSFCAFMSITVNESWVPANRSKTPKTDIGTRYNIDSRQLTLQGKVVVHNRKGYEMQTESLEYAAVDKKIRTTSPVQVKGNNLEVSGKSLLYDTATGNFSLEGNVVCMIW